MTLALTAVAFFMVVLDALVVVTALPSIHRSLGGSLGTLQWTVNAYSMAFGAGIITAAALGDRLGRRRVYTAGLALFTVASAACALAPDIGLLITARAVQGLGAAVITPLSLTILSSAFPAQRRGAIIGIWGGISGLGVAAGPLIGGAVTQGLSWHWVFWVNVPVGVAAVVGARLRLAESHGPRVRLDVRGLVLASAGAATLIWALVQGSQAGWTSAPVLAGLPLGAVLLGAFLAWETRAPQPMIPLGLFRIRGFSAAVAAIFLLGAAIYSAAFLTSEFFQLAWGDSPLTAGLRFLPWTATPLLIAPLAGALSDRIGPRLLMVPGLLLQGAGFAWIVVLAGSGSGYAAYLAPFIIAGRGRVDGHPDHPGRRAERGRSRRARQGVRDPQHAAPVRRGLRRRGRDRDLQLARQPGRARRGDQRVPSRAGRGGVLLRRRRDGRARRPPGDPGQPSGLSQGVSIFNAAPGNRGRVTVVPRRDVIPGAYLGCQWHISRQTGSSTREGDGHDPTSSEPTSSR